MEGHSYGRLSYMAMVWCVSCGHPTDYWGAMDET